MQVGLKQPERDITCIERTEHLERTLDPSAFHFVFLCEKLATGDVGPSIVPA